MTVYYIGGSPCSGKSTAAEALAKKYGLRYFKVDDHLDRYMQMGAQDQKASCLKAAAMTPDEIWMRDPVIQCEEDLMIYKEIFPYILHDLDELGSGNGIITEGAAFLPILAKKLAIPAERYLSITPTKEFQIFHYSKREWVPYILAACSDKAKAFENWMERDALFAEAVRQQCEELGYLSIVNNGKQPIDTLIDQVAMHFGLTH